MKARRAVGVAAVALTLAGCSIPSWVPLVGRPKAVPNVPAQASPAPPAPPASAPVLASPRPDVAPDSSALLDRVICIVNNDAITQFELDEAEAYYYYESKERPGDGEARRALRERLLLRIIDNRLQLQQAEREKVIVEEIEIAEQLADFMKKLNVTTEKELEPALRVQGVTLEGVRKRIREQLMVNRVIRRKVSLRISVTEQEIDRYLEQNREKLEVGLSFEASHILLLPEAGGGDEGWAAARRRAEEVSARIAAGEDFGELAKKHSDDGSGKDGGALGVLKRGELAPEIEVAILALRPGAVSAPFRSQVGYHLFKLSSKETLAGEGLGQARNQIRDILFREKYQARFKDWLAELKQRAVIDKRL